MMEMGLRISPRASTAIMTVQRFGNTSLEYWEPFSDLAAAVRNAEEAKAKSEAEAADTEAADTEAADTTDAVEE